MHAERPFPRLHELPELTRELFLSAGTAYGIVFALSYSVALWGYHASLLAASGADMAWTIPALGFPIALLVCILAGRLAAYFSLTGIYIALWSIAGAILGGLAGWLPFDGRNLAVWLLDGSFWGLTVYPSGSSAATRTTLLIVIGALVGTMVGILERILVELSVDWADSKRGLTVRSVLLLLPTLVLSLALAGAAHELMYSPLRSAQLSIHEVLSLVLEGAEEEADSRGVNYAAVAFHRGSLSRDFTMHTVDHDLAPPTTAVVDVEFDNGFLLRCLVMGRSVTFCDDLLPVLEGWMADLARARGEDVQLEYISSGYQLDVGQNAALWIAGQPPAPEGDLNVRHVAQRGGWIYMTASSGGGFETTCRFHGARPITVDQCHNGGLD